MMAKFSSIYLDDLQWQSVVLDNGDRIFDFLDKGLKAVSIELGGRHIGYFGYRIVSELQIVIRRHEVVLLFEPFMAVDDEVEVGADIIYSAQFYVASQESMREVV